MTIDDGGIEPAFAERPGHSSSGAESYPDRTDYVPKGLSRQAQNFAETFFASKDVVEQCNSVANRREFKDCLISPEIHDQTPLEIPK